MSSAWRDRLCRHADAFRKAKAGKDGLAAHRALLGVLAALDEPLTDMLEPQADTGPPSP